MAAVAKQTNSTRRAAVVFNPTKNGVDELRTAVASAETKHGWAPSLWIATEAHDPGRAATIEALEAKVDLVIAAGGDGTVRTVAGALAEQPADQPTPLAIVPIGTGNLLARTLELPLGNYAAALKIAFGAREQPIDLIEVTGDRGQTEPSVVLSGIGGDAAMIDATSDQLKARVGWIAYLDGLVRALPKLRPFAVRIAVDGRPAQRHKVSAVMFANLTDLPGNVSLAAHSSISDGRLDLIIVQPRHIFDWLWVWRRFTWENAVLRRTTSGSKLADRLKGRNRSQVVHVQCREVEIWIDEEPAPTQVDGDAIGSFAHLRVQMVEHAIRVKAPKPTTRSSAA